MTTDIDQFLNAQHCLTIAAAFIAIIGACATLINSANSKAESLVRFIRDATQEHRLPKDESRCCQLREEVDLSRIRFWGVQRAQRLLFFTIGIFIAALAIFIGLGLRILYSNMTPAEATIAAHRPIVVIGICVGVGTVFMLGAIWLQFWELGKSYDTLSIEMRDCVSPEGSDLGAQQSGIAQSA